MWSLMTWLADSAKSLTVALDRRTAGGHTRDHRHSFVLFWSYNITFSDLMYQLLMNIIIQFEPTVTVKLLGSFSSRKIQYVTVGV